MSGEQGGDGVSVVLLRQIVEYLVEKAGAVRVGL